MNLTVEVATLEEVAPFIERALAYDTTGGMASLADYEHALKFKILDDAKKIIGAYVLTISEFANGKTVCINVAAGKTPGVDMTKTLLNLIRSQARSIGAKQLVVCTMRKSFIEKLIGCGFEDTGHILREAL